MGISYIHGYRDPHKGLKIWTISSRQIQDLTILRVPMHVPTSYKFLRHSRLSELVFKLWGHFLLTMRINRNKSHTVLVREFLTWPLFIMAPSLYFQRNRLWFLCQHNMAFASCKVGHRIILKLLSELGFRFVLYENVEAWHVILGKAAPPSKVYAIPLPFPVETVGRVRTYPVSTVTVGFVGNFRKEKSPTWALDALIAAFTPNGEMSGCQLLVGSPDAEFRESYAQHARVIDTTIYESFVDALKACDVVVLPYEPESYAYRSSGVLAEAVAYGCAVVAPDLPTLRDQVFYPAAVGACYASQADFVVAVQKAVSLVRAGKLEAALAAHHALRGAAGVHDALVGLMK